MRFFCNLAPVLCIWMNFKKCCPFINILSNEGPVTQNVKQLLQQFVYFTLLQWPGTYPEKILLHISSWFALGIFLFMSRITTYQKPFSTNFIPFLQPVVPSPALLKFHCWTVKRKFGQAIRLRILDEIRMRDVSNSS